VDEPNRGHQRRDRLRLAGRWLVFFIAVVLLWPGRGESWASLLVPALSPFTALCSAVAARHVGAFALVAVPVLLLVLVYPRWFCRHGCPVWLLQEVVERFRPSAPPRWRRVPRIGQGLALLTLGGAGLGYPFFLWLDPLAIFTGFLNAWRQPLAVASALGGLGLLLLLLLDLVLPRLWCQRLCPLGATQDLLGWFRRRFRQTDRCETEEERASGDLHPPALGRRHFLIACIGGTGAWALRSVRGQAPGPIRPPGALEEDRFTGVCIRCGNCAQACPSRIIQPDFGASGVAGWLTPRLRFDADYCWEHCCRCNQVCPSGAIARRSLGEKRQCVLGRVELDLDICLLANGGECIACIKRCPYEAIVRQTSDDPFSTAPRVDLTKCNGCGACEAVCPVRPRRAIRVVAQAGRRSGLSKPSR